MEDHAVTDTAPKPDKTGQAEGKSIADSNGSNQNPEEKKGKQPKKHLIKITWLRRTLKTVAGILIFLIILPWLIYIPPIQTLLKDIACSQINKSTGMQVAIERLRLRFPLDVSLDGVCVVEATGDTMVRAQTADVDVKLLPLFKLDVQVKKLRLVEGYYRMVNKDSSMIMKIYAPFFEASPGTSANIKESLINLDDVTLRAAALTFLWTYGRQSPSRPHPESSL